MNVPKTVNRRVRTLKLAAGAAGAVILASLAAPAFAEDGAVDVSLEYTADAMAVVDGGADHSANYLDNLDFTAQIDLEKAMNWQGASLTLRVLSNAGDRPNDAAGTVSSVDNIETGAPAIRLYEAAIEQAIGDRISLRVGLIDLNSDFYATDSSGLLLGPNYGIGNELAATGPAGPSIFPSTALAARLNAKIGENGYVRFGVFNAQAGDPGDTAGVDFSFDSGLILIAEAGIEGPTRLVVGAWRYTNRQDDIRETDGLGNPLQRTAQGFYVMGEQRLFGDGEGRTGTGFLRYGISEGRTTPFKASLSAGLLITSAWPGRPDSAFSLGVVRGDLSNGYVLNQIGGGVNSGASETIVEMTYSDALTSRITVQPDVQYIDHPGADRDAGGEWLVGLRVTVSLVP